ncbi:PREDICTED: esterase E4-like [Eufriesea mexicana]|uniref:esterase E4-like n=1 Tax=Eufriesea mexicana TaxID=516756 RepID=UPI00083C08E0|nr:PREDICTED: esterase E4-like [Eufriesea mexicana]
MHKRQRTRVMAERSYRKYWLGALLVCLMVVNGFEAYTAKVMTKYGEIQGLWSRSTRGRLVAYYLGIPYAQPPVGDLRFRSPQPWNRTWKDTFEATKNAPWCIQLEENEIFGSEDCLYLNIYVPVISENQKENQRENRTLPVLVYVHGGRFVTGTADSRELSPVYLMDQDLILVTINYRLNMLGFFSMASKVSPGNYGLKDIVLALRWVNENIDAFNGDPKRVTLWGHSSGSAAVHMMVFNNKTEGLFNRYIMHGGTAVSAWAMNTKSWSRKMALQMAKLFDCLPKEEKEEEKKTMTKVNNQNDKKDKKKDRVQTTTTEPEVTTKEKENSIEDKEYTEEEEEEIMWCMRNVNMKSKKMAAMLDYSGFFWTPCCIFGPTVEEESEDAVLTMHPLTAMKSRRFRDIPFIIGVTKDEGLMKTMAVLSDESNEKELLNNFEMLLPPMLEYTQLISNTTEFVDAIKEFYFAGNVSATFKKNITQVTSDALIFWPTYQTLKYQSEIMKSSTYFFLFAYEGTFSSTFATGLPIRFGVAHIDDLNYLYPKLNHMYRDHMLHNTESDITMINIMTEMWASFVANGVPKAWNVRPWPNYKNSHKYLQFGINNQPDVVVRKRFHPERMAFWEKITADMIFDSVEVDFLIELDIEYEASSSMFLVLRNL